MFSIFLASVGVLFSLQGPGAGCARINLRERPHSLAFERIGQVTPYQKSESIHRVWLRFRNNTTCAVHVELAQPRQGAPRSMHSSMTGKSNASITMSRTRAAACIFHVSLSDFQIVTQVNPGLSVVFDVPQSHFKDNRTVVLPVSYVWEGYDGLDAAPGSRWVAFPASALPANVRRVLKR